jgi:hypothetical protein
MTVTNAGMEETAKLLIGTGTAFSNIAIGTGTDAFAATSTQLTNEYKRDTATTSNVTTDVAGDTAQFVKTFTFTEAKAITEAGVLNADTTGTLIAAQTFSAVNVDDEDSLEITYKIDVD